MGDDDNAAADELVGLLEREIGHPCGDAVVRFAPARRAQVEEAQQVAVAEEACFPVAESLAFVAVARLQQSLVRGNGQRSKVLLRALMVHGL